MSTRIEELAEKSRRELEGLLQRGTTPDPATLAGWEFRGTNTPRWAAWVGIQKFCKGFYLRDGELHGYNTPVVQNGLAAPWIALPSEDKPKRFGFYRVRAVDAGARDNEYLHALLLDYGSGGNPVYDPIRGLRDYLVQIDAAEPNLFLGKAYYAAGPVRVSASYFLLERWRAGI